MSGILQGVLTAATDVSDVETVVSGVEAVAAGPDIGARISGAESLLSAVVGFLHHLFPGHSALPPMPAPAPPTSQGG